MKSVKIIAMAAVLAVMLLGSSARAQEEVIDLGEIIVSAPMPDIAERLKDLPGTTTVIKGEEFDKKFTSVPELLERTVGVETRSYGGFGGFSVVTIRGASANQVLVMLDGVPLNEAYGGAVNIGNIPVQNVERIEIFRGHAPVMFGGSALGGVVNIVTRGAGNVPVKKLTGSIASFGTHAESVFVTRNAHRWSHAFSGVLQGSNGKFDYIDDNATSFNAADDVKVMRENNAHREVSLGWKASRDGGPSERLKLNNSFFIRSEGVPGLGSNQSLAAGLRTQRILNDIRWERDKFPFKGVSFAAEFNHSFMLSDFYDPYSEIGVGTNNNRNITRRLGAGLEFSGSPFKNHIASLVLKWSKESYSPYDYLSSVPVGSKSERDGLYAALEDKVSFAGGRLLITPSVRYESYDSDFTPDPFTAPTAKTNTSDELAGGYIGARYKLNDVLTLRLNGGRYNRLPSLYEMFGDRGSVVGNPNLAPEEGNNYDAGFGADLQKTFGRPGLFELTYFRSEVKNLITFIQNSQRTARATNIGRAEIDGIEASFQIEPHKKWSLTGNYTWQDAIDDSAVAFWRGNRLPGIHEHQLNFGVRNAFGRNASWYYEWSRDSGNFLDRANTRPVPTRNMANAGLTVRSGEFTTSFEVKNIGDDQISDVAGFPLPGRSFYLTLTREMR